MKITKNVITKVVKLKLHETTDTQMIIWPVWRDSKNLHSKTLKVV